VLLPHGVRIRGLMSWTRADQLLGNGGTRNLAAPLATDSLGPAEIPLLTPSQTSIRDASGLGNFQLTAGKLVAVGNTRVVNLPVILEYGLTSRLTLGVVVPLVETRTTLYSQLNPSLGFANVGPNPALSSSRSTTARSQNASLIASMRNAADTLRARSAACLVTPTEPVCTPLAGQQAAITALLQTTTNLSGALERLYGTSAATPGMPFVPLTTDASQTVINTRVANLQTAYRSFLTKDLVSGSVVPAPGPAANFQLQQLMAAFGRDTLQSVDRSSVGDISIGATYQLLNTFVDTAARDGRHYRMSVNGTFRIGTGQPGSRNRLFDFGTGYGQPGIVVGLAADGQFTRRVSGTAVANYTAQLGTIDVNRVPNAENDVFPLGVAFPGSYSAGNVLSLTIIPRYRLAGNFNVNGLYSLLRIGADEYQLGAAPESNATAPTQPYGVAAATAQQIGLGFSYSTVAGPQAHPGAIPFEVTFNHLETISANGGPIAKNFRDTIELRVYFHR